MVPTIVVFRLLCVVLLISRADSRPYSLPGYYFSTFNYSSGVRPQEIQQNNYTGAVNLTDILFNGISQQIAFGDPYTWDINPLYYTSLESFWGSYISFQLISPTTKNASRNIDRCDDWLWYWRGLEAESPSIHTGNYIDSLGNQTTVVDPLIASEPYPVLLMYVNLVIVGWINLPYGPESVFTNVQSQCLNFACPANTMCSALMRGVPVCVCTDLSFNTSSCAVMSEPCMLGWYKCDGGCCELPTCQTTTLFSPGYKLVSNSPLSFLNLTYPTHLVSPDCSKAFGINPNTGILSVYNTVDDSPIEELRWAVGATQLLLDSKSLNVTFSSSPARILAQLDETKISHCILSNDGTVQIYNEKNELQSYVTEVFVQKGGASPLGGPAQFIGVISGTFTAQVPPMDCTRYTTHEVAMGLKVNYVTVTYAPPVIYNVTVKSGVMYIFGKNFGDVQSCLVVDVGGQQIGNFTERSDGLIGIKWNIPTGVNVPVIVTLKEQRVYATASWVSVQQLGQINASISSIDNVTQSILASVVATNTTSISYTSAKINITLQRLSSDVTNMSSVRVTSGNVSVDVPNDVISLSNNMTSYVLCVVSESNPLQALSSTTVFSSVVGLSVLDSNGREITVSNLTTPISINITASSAPDDNYELLCSYWDDVKDAWDTMGLSTTRENGTLMYTCHTSHLTNFTLTSHKLPYTDVGSPSSLNNSGISRNTIIIAAVVGGVFVLILIFVAFVIVQRKRDRFYGTPIFLDGASDSTQVTYEYKVKDGVNVSVWKGLYGGTTTVAVKKAEGRNRVQRLLIEATNSKRLHHPNVLMYVYQNFTETESYIVYEWMKDCDLSTYMSKSKLDDFKISSICAQVARALSYLESQNYVHTMIDATNVLVSCFDNDVTAKIAGLAAVHDIGELTHRGDITRHSAPEIMRGEAHSTQSSVWSFGALVWTMTSHNDIIYGGLSDEEVFMMLPRGNLCAEIDKTWNRCLVSVIERSLRLIANDRISYERVIITLDTVQPAACVVPSSNTDATIDLYDDSKL